MPEIRFDSKAQAAVAAALAPYAIEMFEQQGGQWTAVVTFGHQGRSEEIKTQDDEEFLERKAKIRAVDLEVVTGPHLKAAEAAMKAARTERMTAGTLLDSAFDPNR